MCKVINNFEKNLPWGGVYDIINIDDSQKYMVINIERKKVYGKRQKN